jgi:thiosulfate reductase cytochrome b subunit
MLLPVLVVTNGMGTIYGQKFPVLTWAFGDAPLLTNGHFTAYVVQVRKLLFNEEELFHLEVRNGSFSWQPRFLPQLTGRIATLC